MCRVRNGNGSNKCESFAPFAVLLQPPATFFGLTNFTIPFKIRHLHHGLVFSLISELGISIQKVSFNVKAQTPHTFLLSHSEASEEGAFSMHCQ